MNGRPIWVLGLAVVALALCGQDAGAFGRRGARCQPYYPVYCPPMQYYCPPTYYPPVYCPPIDQADPNQPPHNPSPDPDPNEQRPLPKLDNVPPDVTDPMRPKV